VSTDKKSLQEDMELKQKLRRAIAGRLSYVERLSSFDTSTEIELLKEVNRCV